MAESSQSLGDEDIYQSPVSQLSSKIKLTKISEHEAATSHKRKDLLSRRLTSQEDPKEMQRSEIELSISCRELIEADLFSKSDPIVVMFTRHVKTKKWVEYGRTEMIRSTVNPDFVKKIVINHHFEEIQRLKFCIYYTNSESTSLDNQDFLGGVVCTLREIIGSRRNKYEAPLKSGSKAEGRIIISAEELSSLKDVIHMKWSGKKLDKKDVFRNPDPCLLFWRHNEDGSFTKCHKTEVVKNTLNPTWEEIKIQSRSLCNGDPERTVKVGVYDCNRGDRYVLIGEFNTSLRRLSRGPCARNTYECIHPKKKVTKKNYQHSGHISLLDFRIDVQRTFLDYIRDGTEMSFVVGIDFTHSNGHPDEPTSLHYIEPKQPNQYSLAIQAVGGIIEDYDTDKLFPAYGFGAKLPPRGQISHCFPINFDQNNPDCEGIKGVLEAYRTCIKKVKLHGPTNFSPIIRRVSEMASTVTDGSEYFVLLMITDGEITDMDATKEEIVNAAKFPMSIIIVGVGNHDFEEMEELNGDVVRLSYGGVETERDIVQFVSMRNHHIEATKDHVLSQSNLAKDVLAKIPDQLVKYMRSRNFHPQETSYEESDTGSGSKAEGGAIISGEELSSSKDIINMKWSEDRRSGSKAEGGAIISDEELSSSEDIINMKWSEDRRFPIREDFDSIVALSDLGDEKGWVPLPYVDPKQPNQYSLAIQDRIKQHAPRVIGTRASRAAKSSPLTHFLKLDLEQIHSDALPAVKNGSQEEDPTVSQVACSLEPAETDSQNMVTPIPVCKRYHSNEVSEDVGPEGRTIKIGGCSVTFPPGCFEQTQQVTVSASIDTKTWPRGKVGITPTLRIKAHDLKLPAIIKLRTWCVNDDKGDFPVEVLHFDEDVKDWNIIHSYQLGQSREIEFQTTHFSDLLGALWNYLFPSYVLYPTVCFYKDQFAIATVLDDELAKEACVKRIKTEIGEDVTIRSYSTFHCKYSSSIKSKIFSEQYKVDFAFTPAEVEHTVDHVIQGQGSFISYSTVESKMEPTQVTLSFQVFKDKTRWHNHGIKYFWRPDDRAPSTSEQSESSYPGTSTGNINVGGDMHLHLDAKKTIGTENHGMIISHKEDCHDVINSGEKY